MTLATLASALLLCSALAPARGCLTSNIDKRAVQWSTSIVQAKLVSLGEKMDLAVTVAPGASTRPSGRPLATAYRVVSFEVTDAIDGDSHSGDVVKVVALIGGKPGDGTCPALMPDAIGKKFILLLRPFEQTRIDLPNGTYVAAPRGAMVIVSQLGEGDMNAETLTDLKTFVGKSRTDSAAVKDEQINAQADAVAGAHDQTEADQAERAVSEIGPAAVPAMTERLKTANDAGKTRLKRLIDELTAPALSAEPE